MYSIGCLSNLDSFIVGGISLQEMDVLPIGKLFGDSLSSWGLVADDSNNSIVRIAGQLVHELPLDQSVSRRRGHHG